MKEKAVTSIEGIHFETGNPVSVEIVDGLISKIKETAGTKSAADKLFIAPGLIDNQINGYGGVDYSEDSLSVEGVVNSAKSIWKHGVTTFVPTLVTSSNETLLRNFGILAEALDENEQLRESIIGFHLEGPYISPDEGFRGCHPVQHVRKPSLKEFDQYQKAAGGRIILVTIAPETDGALEFIKVCRQNGVAISIGHSNASADQIDDAVRAGAGLSTHLGNGCANFIHRHHNPIWPQLANDNLVSSVIADGLHLLPDELRVFYKVKGPDNLFVISDISSLSGMAPGKYTYLGSEVLLTEEGMLLNAGENCLAGASFPIIKGVGNMMKFTGCSLSQAINMASANVARFYNLSDRGTLTPGKRADIIMFENTENQIKIKKTLLGGNLVFSSPNT